MGVSASTQKLEKEDKGTQLTDEEKHLLLKYLIIDIQAVRGTDSGLKEHIEINVDFENPKEENFNKLADYLNSPTLFGVWIQYHIIGRMTDEEKESIQKLSSQHHGKKFFEHLFKEFSKKLIVKSKYEHKTRSGAILQNRQRLFLLVNSNLSREFKELFARPIHDTLKAYGFNKDNLVISTRPVAEAYTVEGDVDVNSELNEAWSEYPFQVHSRVLDMFVEDEKIY